MAYRIFLLLGWVCIMPLAAQNESLRQLAERHGRYIGAAVGGPFWNDEQQYIETLKREFNVLVAENNMKFQATEPQRGQFRWSNADRLADFAGANGMRLRGHCLLWHQALPGWVSGGSFGRGEMLDIMRTHIDSVAGRYRGRVWQWDVVNEAIDDGSGFLRNTVWRERIGDDYLDSAFTFARRADPEALLFYNEYGAEGLGAKSDKVYDLVRGMLELLHTGEHDARGES